MKRLWQALERNVKIVRSLRGLHNTDVPRFPPGTDANRHLSEPNDEPNEAFLTLALLSDKRRQPYIVAVS